VKAGRDVAGDWWIVISVWCGMLRNAFDERPGELAVKDEYTFNFL